MPRGTVTGSRIRDRRLAVGLRQAELAQRVGISASYLNLIEHNRRAIGGKLLAEIARALGSEVITLTEGAEAVLLATLREAAAAAGPGAEADRAEEFAGRFPGWAALLAERHSRVERLEREVAVLSDRLALDPHLSASVHELLTAATAIRSTASILAGTEDLDPQWAARFLANLDAEGRRLAEGATALVRYLDGPATAQGGATTPQEEVEAMFAARGWHVEALEAPGAGEAEVRAIVEGAAELESAAGRVLARAALERYLSDARLMPLDRVMAMAGEPPGTVAAVLRAPPDAVLRRLAFLPGREAGLIVADGAGAVTFRRPVAGFALPRHGAGCPLWPLYQALTRPAVPIAAPVEMPGQAARRLMAHAVALPKDGAGFAAVPVFEAVMLLTPGGAEGAPLAVGPTCRICPRPECPARREPSILGPSPA